MNIRRFAPADADAVVRVSELATRITSGKVYDQTFVEEMVENQTRAYFLRRGEQMHFYVACEDDGTVIGCAAIGRPYRDDPAEIRTVDPPMSGHHITTTARLSCFRFCTALTGRTERSRACSRLLGSHMWGPASSVRRCRWTRRSPRRSWAPTASLNPPGGHSDATRLTRT